MDGAGGGSDGGVVNLQGPGGSGISGEERKDTSTFIHRKLFSRNKERKRKEA